MRQTSGNSGTRKTPAASAALRMKAKNDTPTRESEGERIERIAMAAYYRAEARGFVPGHELDDWIAAESEMYPAASSAPFPA